ncbi:uncharacterized protein LOC106173473 [Lingula anatina]|uniref:Uncharacterized protein LOC106151564 isoform X2 n=1 Tax=Lingula anatina TaxID=7574 RepID=A0A1S3JIW3_LINAN|nr:uncharacterized protein LOC106151564 isoform X2 [Lingula anatina]XP_013410066.1 uncharacterized protein LOC106173473 [Lingula anatina]|eukprot:XP_013380352.1 uncharacterized protein LOC106151564 isoform X2 [Lingula anatina]
MDESLLSPRSTISQMSSVTTPRNTPYWTPVPTPLMRRHAQQQQLTQFDIKLIELDQVKKDALAHLKKYNALRTQFIEWFSANNKAFCVALQTVQLAVPDLVPRDIYTMNDFIKVLEMCRLLLSKKRWRLTSHEKLEEFYEFWTRLSELKAMGDKNVYERTCEFCESITRLREPQIKDKIDRLYAKLNKEYSNDFIFKEIHNERDNLFTYRMMQPAFLGLISYIPYLLKNATKVCYLVTKLHIEKE